MGNYEVLTHPATPIPSALELGGLGCLSIDGVDLGGEDLGLGSGLLGTHGLGLGLAPLVGGLLR